MAQGARAKWDRRKERDSAVLDLNGLATEAGIAKVEYRAVAVGGSRNVDTYWALWQRYFEDPV